MKLDWYLRRLRAMDKEEILWRVDQKRLSSYEKKTFKKGKIPVTDGVFYPEALEIMLHPGRITVVPAGYDKTCAEPRHKAPALGDGTEGKYLISGFNYGDHKRDFHWGFQTDNSWPVMYSSEIQYRGRDDIGDARTNWELNRHFAFPALACGYAATKDEAYLLELAELFAAWNEENPFLWGISWTSVMEVAIRDINWIYTLAFLARGEQNDATQALTESLSCGIINMTSYICGHFSRFSSANNHTIVEACAVGLAGLMADYEPWESLCDGILFEELQRQNHPDGVNKEQSIHYQAFMMEAVGLLALARVQAGGRIPQLWRNTLVSLSRYIADCRGRYGEILVFGDDDDGKILDLQMDPGSDHYERLLSLMSLILPERYVDNISDMTLMCITLGKVVTTLSNHPQYMPDYTVKTYKDGGVSILKSPDGRVLAGFDHGPLGFGAIAAHGHADALSFQIFREGRVLFADPGTYIYHMDGASRDLFRSTSMHNTLCVGGRDQSRMLGPFLWGKRAEVTLLSVNTSQDYHIEAEHDGYFPVVHRRRLAYDGDTGFIIRDRLVNMRDTEDAIPFTLSFILGEGMRPEADGDMFVIYQNDKVSEVARIRCEGDAIESFVIDRVPISPRYGIKHETSRILVNCGAIGDAEIITKIKIL